MSLVRLLGFTTLACGCVTGKYREIATRREIVYVDSEVPLYNRAYFEVRPGTVGPAYRVTVYSADWGKMGGL